MKKKFEVTEERAIQILNSRAIIEKLLTPYKGVEISYIGYVDADGNPFTWTDSDGIEEEYAIVSFKAMSTYQLELSLDELEEGMLDECISHTMSMNMPVGKAQELCQGMLGTLIAHERALKEDGVETGEFGTFVKSFSPIASVEVKTASVRELLAKRASKREDVAPKAKKDKKVKLDLAEEEVDEPKAKKSKEDKKAKKAK